MNLIEQLGGYEHLNGFYKRAVAHGFTLTEIKEELLKYRREHNIFEVGDKVVWKESLSIISSLMEIESLDGDTWGIRHATDLEIEAGRRLSKIKCWSCDKEMSHSDRAENDGFCIHCNAEIEL